MYIYAVTCAALDTNFGCLLRAAWVLTESGDKRNNSPVLVATQKPIRIDEASIN